MLKSKSRKRALDPRVGAVKPIFGELAKGVCIGSGDSAWGICNGPGTWRCMVRTTYSLFDDVRLTIARRRSASWTARSLPQIFVHLRHE